MEKNVKDWMETLAMDLRGVQGVLLLVEDCQSSDDWRNVAGFLGRYCGWAAEEAEEFLKGDTCEIECGSDAVTSDMAAGDGAAELYAKLKTAIENTCARIPEEMEGLPARQ